MRRAYPILHIVLIAALLVAAVAMASETAPVAGGLATPPWFAAADTPATL